MLSRRSLLGGAFALPALLLVRPLPAGAQSESGRARSIDPGLFGYLAQSPLSIASLDHATPLTYGNAKLQMDTLGYAVPFDMADSTAVDDWMAANYSVSLPQVFRMNALRDDFQDLTGLEIGQIFSGAEIGEPPAMATMLRGDFDSDAIQAAQRSIGYQEAEVDGRLVLTIGPDGEMDFSNPVQQMALARLNNAAFLDDGTLVYTPTLDLMRQMLNPSATLEQQPLVQQALAGLDGPTISAVLLGLGTLIPGIPALPGSAQSQDEVAGIILTAQAREPAPTVLTAIAGITPGGPLWARAGGVATPNPGVAKSVGKFSLVYARSEEAALAAGQIEERVATGQSIVTMQPWSEILASWSAVAQPGANTVLVTLEWPELPRPFDLIFQRDTGFITG